MSSFGEKINAQLEDAVTCVEIFRARLDEAARRSKLKSKAFSSPNEMVTFIIGVGEDQENFLIHKQVACQHSEIWDRAFNSSFIEGQTQTYCVEDTNVEVFRLLMQWVYQEKFDHVHSDRGQAGSSECKGETQQECAAEDILLVQLWILADRFLIRKLQNYTMNIMLKSHRGCGAMEDNCYRYLYDNTAKDCVLRTLAVEQKCWDIHDMSSSAVLDADYPAQMLNDMVVVLQSQVPIGVKNKWRQNSEENKRRYLIVEASDTGKKLSH
ncbi:hypothetical protein SBOR_4261 [Sclerotinia borealis F-4128]|uniref:BTB domain-containing protein n=1 Tax=Sclerotinia borealis (strain F-4128) TaxID=1432307 RepID=W9CF23_SCLBF|nr:hypothetical protein SBOR_4261 [Sclerotinia borealis F-4128]